MVLISTKRETDRQNENEEWMSIPILLEMAGMTRETRGAGETTDRQTDDVQFPAP